MWGPGAALALEAQANLATKKLADWSVLFGPRLLSLFTPSTLVSSAVTATPGLLNKLTSAPLTLTYRSNLQASIVAGSPAVKLKLLRSQVQILPQSRLAHLSGVIPSTKKKTTAT